MVLIADDHYGSFTENRIPDKLELTLSNMSGILLFSMFISPVIVAALAEAASLTAYRSIYVMNATFVNASCGWMGYNGGV